MAQLFIFFRADLSGASYLCETIGTADKQKAPTNLSVVFA
ncbi:hypothetical protein SAMN04487925_101736 [Bradyrhizobium sp. cf659]|nr:hypothetical protein SAMN04487925_101736 [Bradyrhizobium sp. cf659]